MQSAETILASSETGDSRSRPESLESRVRGKGAPCHALRNCHHRWPEFRATDSEANNLPGPERAREQAHVHKAGAGEKTCIAAPCNA